MQKPRVIKIGGSLMQHVPGIAELLLRASPPAMIVPGGGPFAGLVRECHAPDEESHWMAILGMEQFGWYIASSGLPTTPSLQVPDRPVVLLPYTFMRDEDPLPHTWEVTSDTIAAWVAWRLGLELVLLKSVDGIYRDGALVPRLDTPCPCAEVDPLFLRFVLEHRIPTWLINGSVIPRVGKFLSGEQVRGTFVGTTF